MDREIDSCVLSANATRTVWGSREIRTNRKRNDPSLLNNFQVGYSFILMLKLLTIFTSVLLVGACTISLASKQLTMALSPWYWCLHLGGPSVEYYDSIPDWPGHGHAK